MTTVRAAVVAIGARSLTVPAGARRAAQPPQPQDEFVPVVSCPPPEQLPAAPLLIGAYVVVLGGALRLRALDVAARSAPCSQDVERLEGELKDAARAPDADRRALPLHPGRAAAWGS